MNKQIGRVKMEGDHVTLKYERRLPHTPEAVWEAITDPKEVSVWFSTTAKLELSQFRAWLLVLEMVWILSSHTPDMRD
jgi:uncharacterized protein YndB with AHSA1/START domain